MYTLWNSAAALSSFLPIRLCVYYHTLYTATLCDTSELDRLDWKLRVSSVCRRVRSECCKFACHVQYASSQYGRLFTTRPLTANYQDATATDMPPRNASGSSIGRSRKRKTDAQIESSKQPPISDDVNSPPPAKKPRGPKSAKGKGKESTVVPVNWPEYFDYVWSIPILFPHYL